jgi:hypothetical protein
MKAVAIYARWANGSVALKNPRPKIRTWGTRFRGGPTHLSDDEAVAKMGHPDWRRSKPC